MNTVSELPIQVEAVISDEIIDAYLLGLLKDSDKAIFSALALLISRGEGDDEMVPLSEAEAREFMKIAKATPLYKIGKMYYDDSGIGRELLEKYDFDSENKNDPHTQAIIDSLTKFIMQNFATWRQRGVDIVGPLKLDRFDEE